MSKLRNLFDIRFENNKSPQTQSSPLNTEVLPIVTNIPDATGGIEPVPASFTAKSSEHVTERNVYTSPTPENQTRQPLPTSNATPSDIIPTPPPALSRGRRIALVALATWSICMAIGSSTSLNIALPTIQRDLNMTSTNLQWVSSAFSLANGCLLLLSGRMADIHGTKLVFVLGMTWQAIWSLIGGFMKSGSGLIVARAMAGAGAAMSTPSAIGMVAANFHGRARATAFAAFSAGAPVGGGLGTVLGGVFVSYTSSQWRGTMWLFAGLGALAAIVGIIFVPPDIPVTTDKRLDWVGAILVTTGLVLLQFSISDASNTSKGWRTPYIIALLVISIILMAGFFFWEYHITYHTSRPPLMRIALWTRAKGRLAAVYFIGFVAMMGFMTISYHASLFFQNVQKLAAIQTTVRFFPMMIFGILYNILAAKLITRVPTMYIIATGLLSTGLANLLFALVPANDLYWKIPFNALWLSVMGADFLMATGSSFISAFSLADEQAVAGALFQTLIQLGGSLGLAITTVVANAIQTKAIAQGKQTLVAELDGLHASFWISTGLSFTAFLIAVVCLRGMGTIGTNMRGVEEEDELSQSANNLGHDREGVIEKVGADEKV